MIVPKTHMALGLKYHVTEMECGLMVDQICIAEPILYNCAKELDGRISVPISAYLVIQRIHVHVRVHVYTCIILCSLHNTVH